MKIAGDLTIEKWKELEKKLKPSYNSHWKEAYEFFESRIETRYVNPIEAILNMKSYKGEGFAVVNLQCSLIETIECFINGWVYQKTAKKYVWHNKINNDTRNKNEEVFVSFFERRAPFNSIIPEVNGVDFFKNVRCGLLHETQTKNNWKIKSGNVNGKSYELKDGYKIIYRENLQKDLNTLIDKYKNAIINGCEFDGIEGNALRKNFISKFNRICEISEE